MKNKDGKKVVRCAVGTKLQSIGYSEISPEGVIRETDAWAWTNSKSAPELFGFDSPVQGDIDKVRDNLEEQFSQIVGKADIALTIYDPEEKFEDGSPVRMVRRAETNLGDFCADAIRTVMEADIGFANGGGIRTDIPEGDLTYEQLLNVYPFNNEICVLEITGQQIIDALEWGVRSEPDENGGFLQVSGLTYEIDVNVPTPCKTNKSGAFSGIEGKRRVRNVKVGDAPIEPDAYYKVAGNTYMMQEGGDGFTMFKDPKTIINNGKLDSEVIIEYIRDHLNGEIGTGYTDPHGEGRITVIQ